MKKTIISLLVAVSIAGCGEDCSLIEQNILMTKNQIQLKKDELAKINNNEEWLNIKTDIAKKEKQLPVLKKELESLAKELRTLTETFLKKSREHSYESRGLKSPYK